MLTGNARIINGDVILQFAPDIDDRFLQHMDDNPFNDQNRIGGNPFAGFGRMGFLLGIRVVFHDFHFLTTQANVKSLRMRDVFYGKRLTSTAPGRLGWMIVYLKLLMDMRDTMGMRRVMVIMALMDLRDLGDLRALIDLEDLPV